MRIKFHWVGVIGVKRWIDVEGKKRQQTKHFRQTVNPFNKNASGETKTAAEIIGEEKVNREAWLAEGPPSESKPA